MNHICGSASFMGSGSLIANEWLKSGILSESDWSDDGWIKNIVSETPKQDRDVNTFCEETPRSSKQTIIKKPLQSSVTHTQERNFTIGTIENTTKNSFETDPENSEISTSDRNKNKWNKRDFCLYCFENVTNFSRHLIRKHDNEAAVQQFLDMKVGSIERKNFLSLLRKKGNFLSPANKEIKMVKRPPNKNVNPESIAVCVYCKGYYMKRYLARHVKTCISRPSTSKTLINRPSESQTYLAFRCLDSDFLNKLQMKEGILNMRSDAISLVVKSEPIILSFGSFYSKRHRHGHLNKVTKTKLRELAHLWINMKQYVSDDSFFAALKPENMQRRVGELERLLLASYVEEQNNIISEEFTEKLSEAEKIILNKYKRIKIRGKRHKPVPVLISKEVQEYTNLLLDVRDNFVPKDNAYLFASISKNTCIDGYTTLRRFAQMSGAEYPESLTSGKLRKHVATISQLYNLDSSELEQLCSFLGHSMTTHQNFYRLPQEIYQTAVLAKHLLKSQGDYREEDLNTVLESEAEDSDLDDNIEQKIIENTDKDDNRTASWADDRNQASTCYDRVLGKALHWISSKLSC
nr:unnamed protein product [Callosobruchus analis]